MPEEWFAQKYEEPSPDVQKTPEYPRAFFELQFQFAQEVMRRDPKLELPEALLRYTSFYRRFGIVGEPDVNDKTWRQFIKRLTEGTENPIDVVYDFYRGAGAREAESRVDKKAERVISVSGLLEFRCKDSIAELHLGGPMLFLKDTLPAASKIKDEIESLLVLLKSLEPPIEIIKARSWLLDFPAFQKRFFPPEFIASLEKVSDFSSAAIWGQFTDKDKQLKTEEVKVFLERTKDAAFDPVDAFPHKLWAGKCAAQAFYDFYGFS